MQEAQIRTFQPILLVGVEMVTTLANDRVREMWAAFMPRRKEIENRIGEELYSMQVYENGLDVSGFGPQTQFKRRAAMQVSGDAEVPEGMLKFAHPGGLYAVFVHRGPAKSFGQTAARIYGEWLPQSPYEIDNRPHFEILDDKYLGPDHPDSEEEVWIPIREKA